MSSGKAGSGGSKDYYGHCAGVVCQGQLDFLWGLLIDNDLAWPTAAAWDSRTWPSGRAVIYVDGNVYQASAKTELDPPAFPWVLLATPWVAGTYHAGDTKLSNGSVWRAAATTALPPPNVVPGNVMTVQSQAVIDGWQYVCTPDVWDPGSVFWPAGSIVAHQGRLYTNSAGTKVEPPGAPWSLWKLDLVANPTKITVEGRGDVYVYRGTADQVLDPVGEEILSAFGHPPYRNKGTIVLKDFLFGTSQQNPPSMQVLGGRAPVQNLIVGAATALDAEWQANPWCVLAEFLTHPAIGLGLPLSTFDQATWQAEADRCAANPSLFYISPLYTNLKKVREIVAELLGYPDAYVFWSTIATLTAGHWPHGEAPPAFDSTNTVDRDVAVGEFDGQSDGWGGVATAVGVSFEDVENGFKSRPVYAPNLFSQQALRRIQTQKIERPFITRAAQALAWATELARFSGDQTTRGSVEVRAERAEAITPGRLFLMTDDVLGTSQVQRCLRKTIAAAPEGKATLEHETERGVAAQPYSPTPTSTSPDPGPPPERIGSYAVAQLPAELGPSSSIAVIAGRRSEATVSFDAWFKQADGAAFQDLGTMRHFAVPGTFQVSENSEIVMPGGDNVTEVVLGQVVQGFQYDLGSTGFFNVQVFWADNQSFFGFHVGVDGSDYVADPDSGKILIVAGGGIATGMWVAVKFTNKLAIAYDVEAPQSDLDLITEPMTEDEINDGKVLLFAFQAANPSVFECMIVQEVTAAGTAGGHPVWFVKVRRAQFGTKIGGDGSYVWGLDGNDVVFLIRRSSIVPLTHESFDGFQFNGATMGMRLTPASAFVTADVTDVWDPATNPAGLTTDFVYDWALFNAPTATFDQTNVNGAAIADLSATFLTTDAFSFTFEMGDVNGDLVSASLVATQAQQDVTLWTNSFAKTSSISRTVGFSLGAGTWGIEIRVDDAAGNHSVIPLLGGDGQPAQIHVETPAGGGGPPAVLTAESPKVYSYSNLILYYGNLLFGLHPADVTLRWQITARNAAYNPAAWNVAAKYGAAISGKYRWGQSSNSGLPPVQRKAQGLPGQTLYAYISRPGYNDSPVVFWNF